MKRLINVAFLATIGLVVLQSASLKVLRSEGAAPGHTGSPGDNYKDCTACHGGSATYVPDWITSNIPESGYIPLQTYTITTINAESEGTRFGFQVSPQNKAGDLLGKLVITDSVQTQLVGDGKYITYTKDGIVGAGSKTWTFDWVAPAAGTGDVVFYGAYNSNFEGHKGENHVFLSTLRVKEAGTARTQNLTNKVANFVVFPNPATDWTSINFDIHHVGMLTVDIIDITGKQVALIMNEWHSGSVRSRFNTAKLPNGNYFVRLQINGKTATQRLSISH